MSSTYEKVETFGSSLKSLFPQDPAYLNLNHGSFGTFPLAIRDKLRHYQDLAEARPDPFIRYDIKEHLTASRLAVSKLLNADPETVVFCSNATTGINVVLRNLQWNDDGKDEILYFNTIYGACGKTIDYIVDTRNGKVSSRGITITYPIEDADILTAFEAGLAECLAAGKRPALCVFDIVTSLPGVRFPFELINSACKSHSIPTFIDGAQGIGMVKIDLKTLDPDYLISNCHKWLHVPRGCCVLHVAKRNQASMRSTMPTSHGYLPLSGDRYSPLPKAEGNPFITNFSYVGTIDTSPFLCVKDSIEWREQALGGEEKILDYQRTLARTGGAKVAQMLGTFVLDNSTHTLTDCAMVNVALPLWTGPAESAPEGVTVLAGGDGEKAVSWIIESLRVKYQTFLPVFVHAGRVWARFSAQVYLGEADFVKGGEALKELCGQVTLGKFK